MEFSLVWMHICNISVVIQLVRSEKKSCKFPVLGIITAPVANTGDIAIPEMYRLIAQWWEGHPGPSSSLLLVSSSFGGRQILLLLFQ